MSIACIPKPTAKKHNRNSLNKYRREWKYETVPGIGA